MGWEGKQSLLAAELLLLFAFLRCPEQSSSRINGCFCVSKLTWERSQLCLESNRQILPPLCQWSWAGRAAVRCRLAWGGRSCRERIFCEGKDGGGRAARPFQASLFLPRRKGELWWNSGCFNLHNFKGYWDPPCMGRWLGPAIGSAGSKLVSRWLQPCTSMCWAPGKRDLSVGALGFSTWAFPSSAWQIAVGCWYFLTQGGSACSPKIANYVC